MRGPEAFAHQADEPKFVRKLNSAGPSPPPCGSAASATKLASLAAIVITCSTWQGITTCSSPGGYVSHETTWNGITTGDDNQGNRWTTSRWRDIGTTTVWLSPER